MQENFHYSLHLANSKPISSLYHPFKTRIFLRLYAPLTTITKYAQGHDDISIGLLKICDSSIVKPLSIIFKNCLQTWGFPNNWKKPNVVPIH